MKVLLIEDEDFIRDLYKRQLDLAGFETDTAANGKDGMAALTQKDYELILLDIMLPDTNGLEILKFVKADEKLKNILIILLTNLGQDAIIEQAFKLGVEGYLIKASLTPNQIVQEIRNIIQNKKQIPTSGA